MPLRRCADRQPAAESRHKARNPVEAGHAGSGLDSCEPLLADTEPEAGLLLTEALRLAQCAEHGAQLAGGRQDSPCPVVTRLKE